MTLTGHVETLTEKYRAEQAAKRVAGVKGIAEEIKVRLAENAARDDEEIARAAVASLEWNTAVPNTIQVKVENGWVTMTGEVSWQYQKETAAKMVQDLIGVRGLTNIIEVKPVVSTSEVRKKIETELKRTIEDDLKNITIEADGSKVKLRGKVHSWNEYDEAERAAWATPGVAKVENQLSII